MAEILDAASVGNIKFLLKVGNIKFLLSVLRAGIKLGTMELVQALVKSGGVDLTATYPFGWTPVFIAASRGLTEVVQALVACGADVNAVDENGCTPIFFACGGGYTKTVHALVQCGGDVYTTDNEDWTPIFMAAANKHLAVICMLVLEYGVDPTRRDGEGGNARDMTLPGSAEYQLLEWLEVAADRKKHNYEKHIDDNDRKHDYKTHNDDIKATETCCVLCLDKLESDAIALVGCGHRLCPGCWARDFDQIHKCPICRKLKLAGVPQNQFPDEHMLYSRFCVALDPA